MVDVISQDRDIQKQNKQDFFIAVFLYAVILTDIIRLFSSVTGITALASVVDLIRNVLYICIFIGYYYYAPKLTRGYAFIIGILFLFLVIFSLLLNNDLWESVFTLSLLYVSRFLLAFVMISRMKNPIDVIRKVTKYAWILLVYLLLYFLSPKDLSTGYAYSITLSYNLLLPTVACLYSFFILRERRLYSLIICIIAIVGMAVYGSRGTIVCIGLASIYIFFYNLNNKTPRSILILFISVIIVVSFLFAKDSLLNLLVKALPNSRSLYLLQNSSFLWDSNRTSYYEMAFKYLQDSPFRIIGLAGDTFVYGDYFGMGVDLGRHSHNLFLELIVSYGIILGGFACIVVLLQLIKGFSEAKICPEMKAIYAFLIVPLLPFLMVSGSLCQSYQYWIVLGGIFSIYNHGQKLVIR